MRINRETLFKIAQDTVAQRTRADRDIQIAYLSGSLLGENYSLGGTADVDLVFIHLADPAVEREIVRLTDDVHLDIAHHVEKDYRQARLLRLHPWLGPALAECKPLYDPHHTLDFIQASVRGGINRTEYILQRARSQVEHARRMWSSFASGVSTAGVEEVSLYLQAVEYAAQGITLLSGSPLAERRFLLEFPARAEAAGHSGLYPGLLGLLGAAQVDADRVRSWLPDWEASLEALPEADRPPRLHPARKYYYRKAIEAILSRDQPLAALWPLLRTWTDSARLLPDGSPLRSSWSNAAQALGLLLPGFGERIAALDAYLDTVEEAVERWAKASGAI
jgi:hypothetical protein